MYSPILEIIKLMNPNKSITNKEWATKETPELPFNDTNDTTRI